jgi:flagellar hook-length control protein FliK
LEVSIKQDHAQVTMVTHSSQVREILDQHLPRLREMLESQGFQSVDAQTQDQQKDSPRHTGHQEMRHATAEASELEIDERAVQTNLVVEKAGKGRVDCYI